MKVVISNIGAPNRNGITYPKEVIEEAIKKLDGAPVLGQIGFSENGKINVRDVSHTVSNLRIEDDNLVGDLKILSTPPGQELSFLLDSVTFRMLGMGNVEEDGMVSDFSFIAINAVDKDNAA